MKTFRTWTLLIMAFLFIDQPIKAQLTDTFKKIDAKNSFKNIAFGSNYLSINKTMKLTKRTGVKNLNRYNINEQKYLNIGIYKMTDAFVEFNKGKLSMIAFTIPSNYKEVLHYFTTVFGTPEFKDEWMWNGENISYVLAGTLNTNDAMVIIYSHKIQFDNGEDNF